MQADNAKQGSPGACRLRGGEFGQAAEAAVAQMGIYLYASGGADQGGQEARQDGAQDTRQPGARVLGRAQARARLRQHDRSGHTQDDAHAAQRPPAHRLLPLRERGTERAQHVPASAQLARRHTAVDVHRAPATQSLSQQEDHRERGAYRARQSQKGEGFSQAAT